MIACGHVREIDIPTGDSIHRETGIRREGLLDRWAWRARMGVTARFSRLVVTYTSREAKDPLDAARRHVNRLPDPGSDRHVDDHAQAWRDRWRATEMRVIGDDAAQRALRFAAYHLDSAANPEDERVSIGARGLTGPVYKGHVFWDTEIYLLPFYTFTYPAAARALLMYRYHTLPAAQEKARKLGYRGALYAWESADTGEDVTPPSAVAPDGRVVQILTGIQEHHISADIAYGVWQYWQATGDTDFFLHAGVEILIETARFWASRGQLEADGRYHIRAVIGPDEYHETVDDNAYTSVMAQWNLELAADAVDWLGGRLDAGRAAIDRMHVAPDEPASWRRIAEAMATGFDPRTNLFEQFEGFFRLDELDLDAYRARTLPIDIVIGHDRTQQSKVIKQADVIALSALLWDRFPRVVHEVNFRYYEPRTAHGSSLSPAVHALVAARLGEVGRAAEYFREAAEIDLAAHTGHAAGGVHMATLGGLWQAAVFGFGGIRLRDDGLIVDPHLPPAWDECSFRLQWRGRRLIVAINREPGRVAVDLLAGGPMTVELGEGIVQAMEPGHRYIARRMGSRWGAWEESTPRSQIDHEGEP
jgi:kojibiose phosphorylase